MVKDTGNKSEEKRAPHANKKITNKEGDNPPEIQDGDTPPAAPVDNPPEIQDGDDPPADTDADPKPKKTTEHADQEKLVIDGVLGSKTFDRWRQIMGASNNEELARQVRCRLNATVDHRIPINTDGISDDEIAPELIEALQRYLKVHITRRLSAENSDTISALQRRLNEGRF